MKKTILAIGSILLIIVIMASTILAVDLDMNLKIRRKINTLLKPYTIVDIAPSFIYLSSNEAFVDPNAQELLKLKNDTGQTYLNVVHLVNDGVTYHYDQDQGILSITGPQTHLIIRQDGSVLENNIQSTQRVELMTINDAHYINLTSLNGFESGKLLGFVEQGDVENGSVIIYNNYVTYNKTVISDKTWIFTTEDAIASYLSSQYDLDFLYKFKNIFSKTEINKVISKSEAFVYPINDKTLFIVDADNNFGYIEQVETLLIEPKKVSDLPKRSMMKRTYEAPIVMTWEAVYSYNPDTNTLPVMNNLNVVSPTWYVLASADGQIDDKSSVEYTTWAQSRGFEVWALVSNAFDIDMTHTFLSDSEARMTFISKMISEASTNGYEGINIDFENVYLEDRDALTHFVDTFSYYAREAGITLSMDVTVMGGSDNWSKCYDHEKLGKIVDFLIIMTYDEHWASSPISGPVASYDWMLHHMTQLTEVVLPEKLIMGVPFYTRVWREYPSNEVANEFVTKSSAIGMEAQNALIVKYELTPIWDDVDKLYYATFFEENAQVKIWIENAQSISAKIQIINDLNLKGVAAWRRGFETIDIWDVFEQINP
ncbi:glycosyl hydrolase family 18 protein [Carnobacterium alterfunditum]|uniref:glycosyl hydrolase family 18 protein n=1 Tax=Carnobacterium alterfunditum TaxID=28230 RepID=UPI003593E711